MNIFNKIFRKFFVPYEEKNVWEILSYYEPSEKYRKECEKHRFLGVSVFPPLFMLGSEQNYNLRYKSLMQYELNYLESLKIYQEFGGNCSSDIERQKKLIEHMKLYPDMYKKYE